MKKNKNIKLYSANPWWIYFTFPLFILLILLGSFILNNIILIIGLFVFKIPDKIKVYKKTILKIWFFCILSNIILAIILWVFTESQLWAFFDNFVSLIIVLLIPGTVAYLLNYLFTFNNLKISKLKKILFSLILAVFTSPYLLFLHFYSPIYHFLLQYGFMV